MQNYILKNVEVNNFRVVINGQSYIYKLVSNLDTVYLTRNFILLNEQGDIVATLSTLNHFTDYPQFEIIPAKGGDILAVITIYMSGTSLLHHSTSFYRPGYQNEFREIFSYHSDGAQTPYAGNYNDYWTESITNNLEKDDKVIELKLVHKNCKTRIDELTEFDCTENTKFYKYTVNEDGIFPNAEDWYLR
jgi:hypothetical protein